jgi:two-component system, chemotaxis family, chemotaxis protein CheY
VVNFINHSGLASRGAFKKARRGLKVASILVIDDEAPMRRSVAMALEKRGHALSEAADGAEALRILAARSIDLVITDLLMPETDGIETILELRRLYPATKIIAISGGGDYQSGKGFLRAAESLGADRTLAKPFEFRELLPAVEALL